MTNTHINVGGHKITTNKVGTVHNTTVNTTDFNSNFGNDGVAYKVVNGICSVLITQITPKTASISLNKTLASGLPKCGLYTSYPIWNASFQNIGYVFIDSNSVSITCHPTTGDMFWCSFVYPVADDWVES